MLKVMTRQKTLGITSNELRIHLKKNFIGKVFLGYNFIFFNIIKVRDVGLGVRI